ncbi:MAG: hypothetical protein EAZ60_19550 [Oscillatoriales cyanobacterium]|nr:MAG: hypothetical protein EAZ79_00445 [Oscillatoriales cyanobacterium]TAF34550.1 MAG: hypothetical protein EAZ69_14620 [Oscillatoriales cyanobacterium]TAF53632.1 MAG: hypothetical protein EAZ60_19550 [Oscillatoriales cyanobacterium]
MNQDRIYGSNRAYKNLISTAPVFNPRTIWVLFDFLAVSTADFYRITDNICPKPAQKQSLLRADFLGVFLLKSKSVLSKGA